MCFLVSHLMEARAQLPFHFYVETKSSLKALVLCYLCAGFATVVFSVIPPTLAFQAEPQSNIALEARGRGGSQSDLPLCRGRLAGPPQRG